MLKTDYLNYICSNNCVDYEIQLIFDKNCLVTLIVTYCHKHQIHCRYISFYFKLPSPAGCKIFVIFTQIIYDFDKATKMIFFYRYLKFYLPSPSKRCAVFRFSCVSFQDLCHFCNLISRAKLYTLGIVEVIPHLRCFTTFSHKLGLQRKSAKAAGS